MTLARRTPLKRDNASALDSIGRRRAQHKMRSCRVCGAEFKPRNGMQVYCSPPCAIESEMETVVCELCGATVRKRKQGTPGRFCSVSCSSRATAEQRASRLRKERPPRLCEWCNEPFELESSSDPRRFCSRRCLGLSRRTGRKRTNPREWGLSKKLETACRNCGRRATHLHHIVPRSKSRRGRDDWKRNGLPLCIDCHRGWHDRVVTIPHRVMMDEEFGFAVAVAGGLWVERNYPDEADVALQRLDEIVHNRVLNPDRQESADERIARVTTMGLVPPVKPWQSRLPEEAV